MSGREVYLQRFAADGNKVGAEIRANSYTYDSQQSPQIDAWSDGSFVVTWASQNQDGSGWGVYAQSFDASGSPVGGELRVNANTNGDQYDPDVVALADGRFVVTWESHNGQDGSGYGVFSRTYDPQSGFNMVSIVGNSGNNLIIQAGAVLIDGGAGAAARRCASLSTWRPTRT
jgi:hypothetical protein